MAIGLEDGSASRNATLGTAGAIWPLPMVMRPRPRVPPSFSCSAAPSWRWLDWSPRDSPTVTLYALVKTVEYQLRNSYIKLDITSRRALTALLS
jgi:hypothetical protein